VLTVHKHHPRNWQICLDQASIWSSCTLLNALAQKIQHNMAFTKIWQLLTSQSPTKAETEK